MKFLTLLDLDTAFVREEVEGFDPDAPGLGRRDPFRLFPFEPHAVALLPQAAARTVELPALCLRADAGVFTFI